MNGGESFNWLKGGRESGISPSGIQIQKVGFAGIQIQKVDFAGIQIQKVGFAGIQMQKVDFASTHATQLVENTFVHFNSNFVARLELFDGKL